ncbi:MAG: hypothetical protein HUK22_02930, partial [Thermoguttaceae bacterium]|nr:hypothetical protein [Thermoguttaceae bacterium]
ARLFQQLIDFDIDYFSAWSYSSAGVWQGYPAICYPVAVNLSKFKNAKVLHVTAEKDLAEGVDVDAVAGFDEETQTLYLTAFNFKFDLNYADAADVNFTICAPFWAGKNVQIVKRVIDDRANYFCEWLKDRERLNVTDEMFHWSPDSGNLDVGIVDAELRAIYNKELRPKYVEISGRQLPTHTTTARVGADGKIELGENLARHGVVVYEIAAINE